MRALIAVGGPDLGFTGGGFDFRPILMAVMLLIIARSLLRVSLGLPSIVIALLTAPLLVAAGERFGHPTVLAGTVAIMAAIAWMRRRTSLTR